MKHLSLLLIVSLSLFSCHKNNDAPTHKNIIFGTEFGISIGSSYADVYSQLQISGKQYGFSLVSFETTFTMRTFEQLSDRIPYYDMVGLFTKDNTHPMGIHFRYTGNTIDNIAYSDTGTTVLVPKWPQDASNDAAIKVGDPVSTLAARLKPILELPAYKDKFYAVLPSKTLSKAYDPAMASYDKWYMFFSKPGDPTTRYEVELYFSDGKLKKLQYRVQSNIIID